MGYALSVCPYCSCGCGIVLATQGGRLVGTHPILGHPSSRGSLCMRGWNAVEAPHHPDRLKVPAVRENGDLVQTSAAKALETITQRMAALRAKKGASVLRRSSQPMASSTTICAANPWISPAGLPSRKKLVGLR